MMPAGGPINAGPGSLIVDADTVLPAAIPVQSFETIARRGAQVVE
jgi:hypothetical protein